MKLFDGKKEKQKILKELSAKIKKSGLEPKLAVILVGDDDSSKLYVELKKKAAKKVGMGFEEFRFPANAPEEDIIKRIQELNGDEKVNGIIVQLPLPAIFNTDKIISAISPEKDVDGFHKENQKKLEKGEAEILPVLPCAILAAAQAASDISGKKAFALVNSETLGQALQFTFKKAGGELSYLVRNTCLVLGNEKEMRLADILITVCGCPNLVKGEMIKEGAVLVDAGITRYYDGKVVGDVDAENVKSKAVFLTPVPGGIGPMTVALLLKNVYLAACLQAKKAID